MLQRRPTTEMGMLICNNYFPSHSPYLQWFNDSYHGNDDENINGHYWHVFGAVSVFLELLFKFLSCAAASVLQTTRKRCNSLTLTAPFWGPKITLQFVRVTVFVSKRPTCYTTNYLQMLYAYQIHIYTNRVSLFCL
jgi:hypothetical protein